MDDSFLLLLVQMFVGSPNKLPKLTHTHALHSIHKKVYMQFNGVGPEY